MVKCKGEANAARWPTLQVSEHSAQELANRLEGARALKNIHTPNPLGWHRRR